MSKSKTKKSNVIKRNKAYYNENLVKGVKIFGILILIFAIIYIGTAIATGEIKLNKDETKEEQTIIQDEEILAGSTFNINKNEYMVLYYDFTNNNSGIYDMLYSNYTSSQKDLPKMYKVDLSKGFNKGYLSDGKLNQNPSNINELKVKDPTLIRIKDKKVVKFISSKDEIKKYINGLI